MEAKQLRKYFLAGSLKSCIGGAILSLIGFVILYISFTISSDYVVFPIIAVSMLFAGPMLLWIAVRDAIKASRLTSKLTKNGEIKDIYRAFSDKEENLYIQEGAVIISDKYLFLKDEVVIIPYSELTRVYVREIKNNKKQVTGLNLLCDTAKKKKISILTNVPNKYTVLAITEQISKKNPQAEIKTEE